MNNLKYLNIHLSSLSGVNESIRLQRQWENPVRLGSSVDNLMRLQSEWREIFQQRNRFDELTKLQSEWRKIFQQGNRFDELMKLQSEWRKVIQQSGEISKLFKLNRGWEKLLAQPLDVSRLAQIQSLVDEFESDINQKQQVTESISKAENELQQDGILSFGTIITLISLFFAFLSTYPSVKEIYKDITVNPLAEICGFLNELEKEAVKFAVVNHRSGIPLFQYPKGKKTIDFLMDGTQICFIAEPKGNAKRVKVIYQSENNTQISGYVERNKLKRLYKIE